MEKKKLVEPSYSVFGFIKPNYKVGYKLQYTSLFVVRFKKNDQILKNESIILPIYIPIIQEEGFKIFLQNNISKIKK